jgi:glutamate formiminotransferase
MDRLIACVPNFSEGRDRAVIEAITATIDSVEGVKLLDVDPGRATNRTVVTLAGHPEAVMEAAVRAGAKASELIDMRTHSGEHPRFGAMDVCPIVPLSGVTMEEAAGQARELARRLGEEVGLTVYLYEQAALVPERRNLAAVRAGEYEGLAARLGTPEWQPDFGPAAFNPRSGATAVGARSFLVALNVNLNTTSTRRANAIAFDVRERGRPKRLGDPLTGEIELDEHGEPIWIPGSLEHVKAIGWYIEEYGIAQVSMNLTDIEATPIHVAFDEVCRRAEARGIRVTGSELVGLVPLEAMLAAGRHYLRRQRRSTGVSDAELVRIAVRSLGLADLSPFDPRTKIIEYAMDDRTDRLVDRPLPVVRGGDGLRVGRPRRRLGLGDPRRAGRCPRRHGGQPLVAQAGVGRSMGGVLRPGRGGEGVSGRAGRARRCGHRRLQRRHGGPGHAEGKRRGAGRQGRGRPGGDPAGDRSPVPGHGSRPLLDGDDPGDGRDRQPGLGVRRRRRRPVCPLGRVGSLSQRPHQRPGPLGPGRRLVLPRAWSRAAPAGCGRRVGHPRGGRTTAEPVMVGPGHCYIRSPSG